jgi:hypothetical protein
MAICKFCKKRIEWQKVERKIPKKVVREIYGKLQAVYEDFRWQPYNPDKTQHNCRV